MLYQAKNDSINRLILKNKFNHLNKPLGTFFYSSNHFHFFLISNSSLRSNISAKQQILATIDKATYLASRKDVQKANIEKTIKELVCSKESI